MMKMENEINVTVPLEVVKASEIEPKEVKWLWYPYIPFGKVTLLQGDPGDGKSKLMLSIAALLSKGEPLPFTETEENEPMLGGLVFRRNRHNVYQAVTRTEMLKILGFRFLALADDINDRSTLTATGFIGVVFLSHSCHKPSPPINGIAPKRPCKYPLRMFSPFLGEKDASEYNSVAQDFSSFSANHI